MTNEQRIERLINAVFRLRRNRDRFEKLYNEEKKRALYYKAIHQSLRKEIYELKQRYNIED